MNPVIVITGPTCVGKSNTAVLTAKKLNGEIISADSIQVYRGLDIGSAKITPEEMQGIKHHLIDFMEPTEEYNVTLFQQMGRTCIHEIQEQGKIPIIAGGTGFYIQALVKDVDFNKDATNQTRREDLMKEAEGKDPLYLYSILKDIDPVTASVIDPYNLKRVARAIEFYESSGLSLASHNKKEMEKPYCYDTFYFVLYDDREQLYERIDKRVDTMMQNGLLTEVERCFHRNIPKDATSMQGIGYKELYGYLCGECTLEEAVARIKINSRHFAKRQITWFKREKNTIWINVKDYNYDLNAIAEYIVQVVREGKNEQDLQ